MSDMAIIFEKEDEITSFKILYKAAMMTTQGTIFSPCYTFVIEDKKTGKRLEHPLPYSQFKEMLALLNALDLKDVDDLTEVMRNISVSGRIKQDSKGGEVF